MKSNTAKRAHFIIEHVKKILVQQFNPSLIYLFGSRAKSENKMGSDFDFALEMKKPDAKTLNDLIYQINRVSGLHHVDLIFLKSIEHEFRTIVEETGKIIYEKK